MPRYNRHVKKIATLLCALLLLHCGGTQKASTESPQPTKIETGLAVRPAEEKSKPVAKPEPQPKPQPVAKPKPEDQVAEQHSTTIGEPIRPTTPAPPQQAQHGPNGSDIYSIPVYDNPYVGPKYAKVTMVNASEFGCIYCKDILPMLATLRKKYGRDLKIVSRQYIVYPKSKVAALAVCAAHKQRKYQRMANALWKLGVEKAGKLSNAEVLKIARSLRFKPRKFKRDFQGAQCETKLERDRLRLAELHVHGVPTFFINGRMLEGAQPIQKFEALIDEELAIANIQIKAGTKLRDYYKGIVANGKTSL